MTRLPPYSSLAKGPRISLADALPLPGPFSIFLETRSGCNFRCRQCEIPKGPPVTMPDWMVAGVLSDLRRMPRLKCLRLYGDNEPLLDRRTPGILAEIKQAGIADRVELTTNASALTPATSIDLLMAGLDYLRVSVYGFGEEGHRQQTRSTVPLARIVRNVREFRALRDMSGARTVIYVKALESKPEQDRFRERWAGIADEVAVEPLHGWAGDRPGPIPEGGAREVCPLPFFSAFIKADGRVRACCFDWQNATTLGNLHEEPLPIIWSGARAQAFRRMHLERRRSGNASCAKCRSWVGLPDVLDAVPADRFHAACGEVAPGIRDMAGLPPPFSSES